MIRNRDLISKRNNNPVLYAKRIALGINTSYRHKLVEYDPLNYILTIANLTLGLLSLISAHSSGKSVLMKRIACYWRLMWPKRPGIIFDMQGVDWRTIKYRGVEGLIFKNIGESYFGFGDDLKNFTPLYLADHLPLNSDLHDDKVFGISWKDINSDEWDFLIQKGTEGIAWVYKFKYHMEKYRYRIKSFKQFIEECEITLRSAFETKKKEERYNSPIVPDYITTSELISLIGTLKPIYNSGFLLEDDDPRRINIVGELKSGKILNFSFWGDHSNLSKVYTAYLFRRIREYYFRQFINRYPKKPNTPWIIWEEADKAAPAGENSISGKQMVDLITKDMKVGYKFAIIAQMLGRLEKRVRDAVLTDPMLIARPAPDDIQALSANREQVKTVLNNLDMVRDKNNTLEWAYLLDSGQTIRTFRPAASQCEFLQRF